MHAMKPLEVLMPWAGAISLQTVHVVAALGAALFTQAGCPVGGGGGGGNNHSTDPCIGSAQDLRSACRDDARAERSIALANCHHVTDPLARTACMEQAALALDDALAECGEHYDARIDVCDRLSASLYDPLIDPLDFVGIIDNPYMPLLPGTTRVYEGQTAEGLEHIEYEITHNTKVILGVTCIEVHDVVSIGGLVVEDTLDWFAQDTAGNVWYFGENSRDIEDGLIASLEGSWIAGVDGAKPGIAMHALPTIGVLYRQEFAQGIAEDLASVTAIGLAITVPTGSYINCLQTEDFTPMDPEHIENKFYAPGVGSIREVNIQSGEFVELIEIIVE